MNKYALLLTEKPRRTLDVVEVVEEIKIKGEPNKFVVKSESTTQTVCQRNLLYIPKTLKYRKIPGPSVPDGTILGKLTRSINRSGLDAHFNIPDFALANMIFKSLKKRVAK